MEKMIKTKLDKILAWITWIVIVGFLLLLIIHDADAHTQTNTSGDNTVIETMDSTTNNDYSGASSVDNSSSTSSSTTVRSTVGTASAPGLNSGLDTCALSVTGGVQTFNFGISGGTNVVDENCLRIKNSRQLNDLGMRVAAIALMCQDENVFKAMWESATFCPVLLNGKSLIGQAAYNVYVKYPGLINGDFYATRQKMIEDYRDKEIIHSTGR
jgi:hypothetical protein